MKKIKKTCPSCGGSGQICFFQGVSRFLLTMEECPECIGIGYLQKEVNAGERKRENSGNKPDRKKRGGQGKK
ncbi:MAG: hypothetical protein SCH71_00535 [Desulfobulbaceae bacterium]|nr:hypothetical protein [Desulfobulbaceae bacterium]